MPHMTPNWLDRAVGAVAPRWQFQRMRARAATDLMRRHYEGAGMGRRQQGWRRSGADVNATIGPSLHILRETARDLVRNNPYAESALSTIADHAVGWGIVAKPAPKKDVRALAAWDAWAGTTACDADGRHDFYGLQKLVMRTVVESGECLVRRRLRRPEDGLPLPLQLQVLDPDFLDTSRDTLTVPAQGLNRIIQGVEFDAIGRRIAYWIFPQHPGSMMAPIASVRVPADLVLHIFKPIRPGQVRGPSWFAPVLLRFKDFDEFEDATLMKQKIAACLAVITSDASGSGVSLGGMPDDTTTPPIDLLEPGAILNIEPGRTVDVVQPPATREYDAYSRTVLRAIATGLGVTYEDLTGDYQDMPFSAARMSRLRHEARVHDWRWRILIPQFCNPVWAWFTQAALIMGQVSIEQGAEWTPPPLPMVDPANEGRGEMQNVRAGLKSWSEMVRERGFDPDDLLAEIASDNQKFDTLGIIFDSDPRKVTQAGISQTQPAEEVPAAVPAPVAAGSRGWRR